MIMKGIDDIDNAKGMDPLENIMIPSVYVPQNRTLKYVVKN